MRLWQALAALLMTLGVLTTAPAAPDAEQRLRAFLNDVRTLSGDFRQVVRDVDGTVLESSVGTFRIARPGHFRWEYTEPFRQLIVADGEQLWVYDPELKQATVKPLADALDAAPAQLLAGDDSVLQRFEVRALPDRGDGLEWIELVPGEGAAEGQVETLRLAFDDGRLRRLEAEDAFAQITTLEFRDVTVNPELPPDAFAFEPPPGVDVVGTQPLDTP